MIDKRVALSLDTMQRAAKDALSFVAELSEEEFLDAATTQMACAMCLILI